MLGMLEINAIVVTDYNCEYDCDRICENVHSSHIQLTVATVAILLAKIKFSYIDSYVAVFCYVSTVRCSASAYMIAYACREPCMAIFLNKLYSYYSCV